MNLYVQLLRAERWEEGLCLFRKPARGDFIEPKNVLDGDMRNTVLLLERLGDGTRQRFERDYKHEKWFQDWNAIVESIAAPEVANEDDASLWCDSRSWKLIGAFYLTSIISCVAATLVR
jgi:hypothetical protein